MQYFIKREYNFIESLVEITNKYKISQAVYDNKISYTKYMVMTYTTLITFFFEAMQQDSHVSNAFHNSKHLYINSKLRLI